MAIFLEMYASMAVQTDRSRHSGRIGYLHRHSSVLQTSGTRNKGVCPHGVAGAALVRNFIVPMKMKRVVCWRLLAPMVCTFCTTYQGDLAVFFVSSKKTKKSLNVNFDT